MHCWQAEATTLPRLVEDERRHLEAAKYRHTHTLDRYRKRDYQAALLDFGSMFPSAFDLVCTGSKAEYVGVINATVPFYSIVRNEQSIVRTFHALSTTRHTTCARVCESVCDSRDGSQQVDTSHSKRSSSVHSAARFRTPST